MTNPNVELPRAIAASTTAAGALTPGKHQPVDATAGTVAMTLPAVSTLNARAHLSVEKIDATTNTVTITGSIRGVANATVTLWWQYETLELRADDTGSWWPQAGHKTKAALDAAYDAKGVAAAAVAPFNLFLATSFH